MHCLSVFPKRVVWDPLVVCGQIIIGDILRMAYGLPTLSFSGVNIYSGGIMSWFHQSCKVTRNLRDSKSMQDGMLAPSLSSSVASLLICIHLGLSAQIVDNR